MKRLLLLSMLLISSLLVGCTSSSQEEATSTEETTEESSVDSQSEDEVSEEDQDVSEDEETSQSEDEDTSYVYVDEAGREVTLEKTPERIVTTYLPLWESLLMLGVQPVGVSGADNYIETWDPFQDLDLGDVVDIGDSEVNLEVVAELQPDLILDQTYDLSSYDVDNYEKIAPTAVFGPESKMDWRLSLREVGKLVNREEKAEEVIAEVEANLAESRERLAEAYDGKTVMQMSLMSIDSFYIAYRADLYDDETGLGLNLPEGYTTSTNYEQISMEALVAMDPDYLFVNVFDGDEAMFEEFQENSVWQSLTAVKEGHVYRLDGSGHAASALSTEYTVNSIVDTLLGQ